MKPMGSSVTLYENGTANVSGIDYGPKVLIESDEGDVIVLRVPGHKRWAGIGSTAYVPPRLLVYEAQERYAGNREVRVRVRGIVEISLARKSTS